MRRRAPAEPLPESKAPPAGDRRAATKDNTDDENPKHREDFTALVLAAVKRRAQED